MRRVVIAAVAVVTIGTLSGCKVAGSAGNETTIIENSQAAVTSSSPSVPAFEPGTEYIGTWWNNQYSPMGGAFKQYIQINKDGAIFTLKLYTNTTSQFSGMRGTIPATYQNGMLHTSGLTGDVAYSQSTNTLLFGGGTYIRDTRAASADSSATMTPQQEQEEEAAGKSGGPVTVNTM
jgi:hypothetical protein